MYNNTNNNILCNFEEMDFTKLSKSELIEKCQQLGISKCKSKNKCELINIIQKASQTKKKS
jgi:hypothetical protein